MQAFEFHLPTVIDFGSGVVQKVGLHAQNLGTRVFVVVGRQSAKRSGSLQTVERYLEESGLAFTLFEEVEPNPSDVTIEEGARLAKQSRCDLVVGLGGGSVVDAAKAIAVLLTNTPPISRYYGENHVPEPIAPVIAIPTTAGTGSEVTTGSIITDTRGGRRRKTFVASSHLFPKVALVDPELTVSLPPSVTSDTGIDAVSHAIESFVSRQSNPLTRLIALRSVKLLGKYLPVVMDNPRNILARSKVHYGSLLAGIAIGQAGTALAHIMGYRLTSDLDIPHGRANGLLLPWIWSTGLGGDSERIAALTQHLSPDLKGLTQSELIEKAPQVIRKFMKRVHLTPGNIGHVREETVIEFAKEVLENKVRLKNNPCEVSFDQVIEVYKKALGM